MADAIITFVDGNDPLWRKDYQSYAGGGEPAKRFRDWGTLKYLLRGVEKHLPWVERVFLVVSRESQYPEWGRQGSLIPLLHRDIIPERLLPTFNSCTIEMFLHRIPSLSERFLYFNDDMFVVEDVSQDEFFPKGRARIGFSRHLLAPSLFKKQVRNSDHLAREALGMGKNPFFVRPQHIISPMLKSESAALFEKMRGRIEDSISPLRTTQNFNQYIYLDYLLFQGKAVNSRLSKQHFSLAAASIDKICDFIASPTRKLVCINDVQMSDEKFDFCRGRILEAFQTRYPGKSRFEL